MLIKKVKKNKNVNKTYSLVIVVFDFSRKKIKDIIDIINKIINKISLLKLKNENNNIILSKNRKFTPKNLRILTLINSTFLLSIMLMLICILIDIVLKTA